MLSKSAAPVASPGLGLGTGHIEFMRAKKCMQQASLDNSTHQLIEEPGMGVGQAGLGCGTHQGELEWMWASPDRLPTSTHWWLPGLGARLSHSTQWHTQYLGPGTVLTGKLRKLLC